MSTLKEIETAVTHLSQKDLAQFREWFADFDAAIWDKQFEKDVISGKLDSMAEQVIRDFEEGKCTEL